MKKIISLLLATALCLGLSAPAFASGQTFTDVPPDHWAYAQIERAYADGAVGGSYHDPATGERRYSPNDPLTLAQLTAILTRAFYSSEVNVSTATGTWYAQNEAVARAHSLLDGVKGNMDDPVSRYNMAALLCNVLRDKGADMPTAQERSTAISKIPDWGSVPAEYRQHVCDVYYLGIIGGIDTKGTFDGGSSVSRAVAATIYGRTADTLAANNGGEAPEQPTPTPTPEPTPPPSGAAAIGTISSEKVTLSLDTHSVDFLETDYWAEQSAEIQRLTAGSEQAFNAAVHSLINVKLIAEEGEFGTGLIGRRVNQYYNYSVYKPEYTRYTIVESALGFIHADLYRTICTSFDGLWFFSTVSAETYAEYEVIFEPYLRQITPGMTDREKADLMMRAVTDKIDYKVSGGANWLNGKTTGDCDDYGIMVAHLFSAAGLPNILVTGTTNDGAGHTWNQVYLPDEQAWFIYDGTHYEGNENATPLSFEAHANKANYDNDKMNNKDQLKVCRALIETACKYA